MIRELENGSLVKGELPDGCKLCGPGRKMVLFVTGLCDARCFYCPLSEHKKNIDVIYADEMPVNSDSDILEEARLIGAMGTGITGGDPLKTVERTAHYIRFLKENFGEKHHIHLYTATFDTKKAEILANSGLDELRFHPPAETWGNFERTPLYGKMKEILKLPMHIGVEIPALPDMKSEMMHLIEVADSIGVEFINLNELEFAETNYKALLGRGYEVKDDVSSAAKGSEEVARGIVMESDVDMTVHYCSASFKDGVQLRNRLRNRAENVAKPYEVPTEDGTIMKGIIYCDDVEDVVDILKSEFEVPDELINVDVERSRIEIAPWVLEEIYGELPCRSYIIEEYPTWDRLEVERIPLRGDNDGS
jgi:pyruvate formate-lyase activating enzyme-like uncharacterized protein